MIGDSVLQLSVLEQRPIGRLLGGVGRRLVLTPGGDGGVDVSGTLAVVGVAT